MTIRVLIADDDSMLREALGDLLEAEGFDVVARGRDGAEAVALAETEHPDIAVIDIRMPGIGGIEAMRRIAAARPETRLVALSAYDDGALSAAARAAGAADYITKGTRPSELCRRIRDLAEQRATA